MEKNFVNGTWENASGSHFQSIDPATGKICFEAQSTTPGEVDEAVAAANRSFHAWALMPVEERIEIITRYKNIVLRDAHELARIISTETGKPFWETKTEAAAVAGKIDISIHAYNERTGTKETATGATTGILRHKPHGVMAVLGPFNFPAHLPNGHIIPALIAGNTVVFKPSELAPSPATFIVRALEEAGVPPGVVNLVHGGRETGEALADNDQIDGLLFTGGARTGAALHKMFAGKPEKILALELGGNNPLIWWGTNDLKAAAFAVVQSAFSTAGQRCTCARRLILPTGQRGDEAIEALLSLTDRIRIDEPFADPQPFMGPVISADAAARLERAFDQRVERGGTPIRTLSVRDDGGAFVTPGIIDVTDALPIPDEEHFGPMLQIYRVSDFDQAIKTANDTAFGLSAGLLDDDEGNWHKFLTLSRAGIVNWNRQTTGASSAAPFGGVGLSGNHKPSAFYAADYCAFPVASMEGSTLLSIPEGQIGLDA